MKEKHLHRLQQVRTWAGKITTWALVALLLTGLVTLAIYLLHFVYEPIMVLYAIPLIPGAAAFCIFLLSALVTAVTHILAKRNLDSKVSVRTALNGQFPVEWYERGKHLPLEVLYRVFPKFWYPGGNEYVRGVIREKRFECSNIHCTVGDYESDPTTEKFRGQWFIVKTERPFPADLLVQPRFSGSPGPQEPSGTEYAPLNYNDFKWAFPENAVLHTLKVPSEDFSARFFAISDNAETAEIMLTSNLMEALAILGRDICNWLYLVVQTDGTVHLLLDSKRSLFEYQLGDTPLTPGDVQRRYQADAKYIADTVQTILTGLE